MNKSMLFAAGVAFSVVSGAALAAEDADVMANTYENTVVLTAEDGTVTKVLYNADNTYTANGEAGTWRLDSKKLCTTPADGEETCDDVEWGHAVGDEWISSDGTTKIFLMEGRE